MHQLQLMASSLMSKREQVFGRGNKLWFPDQKNEVSVV